MDPGFAPPAELVDSQREGAWKGELSRGAIRIRLRGYVLMKRTKTKALTRISAPAISQVLPEIRQLVEAARRRVVSTANLTLVWLNWNVGRVIAVDIQKNRSRADYGEQLIEALSARLIKEYGAGYSARSLLDMRRFHEHFKILPPLGTESIGENIPPPLVAESDSRLTVDFRKHSHLSWTHYRILLGVKAGMARRFYFEQAASQRWSKRELQDQIDRALYERVALSRDTRALIRLEKKRGPVEIIRYEDAFKDPYLLDFLGLKGAYSEKDLESAILANLQEFLSELGSDFCFIRRQYPMRIDDDDHFLDLLFYHRRLRCLVAAELKIGAFTAADKGQMDLYLSWLKRHEWRVGENEPAGLILCTSKKQQHVELLLAHGPHKMQVSEYLIQLPSRGLLEERLKIYSRLLVAKTPGKGNF